MARIYPFRAWRYNPSAVRLDDVVTQPTTRSHGHAAGYYQRCPYNLVRIILDCLSYLTPSGTKTSIRARRGIFAPGASRRAGRGARPVRLCLCAALPVPGTDVVKERRGFIALGKLHDYSENVVFRHEQTLSKPRATG